ncbi:MAG: hypothetical protein HKN31_09995, partial [Pricia sp.]|nr:hypothetical protein [Pricia sp.]
MPHENKTYTFFTYLIVVLSSLGVLHAQNNANGHTDRSTEEILETALKIRYQNPDSSIVLLQKAHEKFIEVGDSIQAIEVLLEMPYIYGQRVNYASSYDVLWLALFLADDLGNDTLKASIYGHLGRLYSFFKRKNKAFEFLDISLEINKNLVKKGELDEARLVENYYLFCATYRELDNPEMGKVYLDSCYMKYSPIDNQVAKAYLEFERAFIESHEGKSERALQILRDIEPWFQENRPSYLVLVYTYWGDIYGKLSEYGESQNFYRKALEVSDRYNSHVDFSPLIYEKLTNLYKDRGDYQNALVNLQKAKDLDSQYFDSRSQDNISLLEIKDEFRLEKERQEKLIQSQRLAQLEQQDKISLLQRIILIGTIVFLIFIGWIYLKQLRSKHKAEKQLIRRNKELEIQKAKELLELKNKELATSALQLVEKDEFLKEIKRKLRDVNQNVKTSELN